MKEYNRLHLKQVQSRIGYRNQAWKILINFGIIISMKSTGDLLKQELITHKVTGNAQMQAE